MVRITCRPCRIKITIDNGSKSNLNQSNLFDALIITNETAATSSNKKDQIENIPPLMIFQSTRTQVTIKTTAVKAILASQAILNTMIFVPVNQIQKTSKRMRIKRICQTMMCRTNHWRGNILSYISSLLRTLGNCIPFCILFCWRQRLVLWNM